MDKDKVSIVVPVYNIEKYITRCVDSLLNQTYKNIEVICVDDGSKDKSLSILNEYAKKDSRLVIISKENGGVSSARNLGIKKARGEYITFVDGDDFIDINMIEEMINIQKETNADIVKCSYVKDYIYKQIPYNMNLENEINVYDSSNIEELYNHFMKKYILNSMCCQIIKTEIIKDNNLCVDTNYVYGEDARFNYELYTNIKKAILIDRPYYHYFYNDNSATTIKSEEKITRRIKEALSLYDSLYEYIKKWNMDTEENRQTIAGRVIKEFIYRSRELFTLSSQGYSKKQITELVTKLYSDDKLQKSLKLNNNRTIDFAEKELQMYSKYVLCGNIQNYVSFGIYVHKVKNILKKIIKKAPRG